MDTLDNIIKRKDEIMKTFNLTEEDFKYMLSWFENESLLNDVNADDPTLVLKNATESYKGCTTGLDDDKGNTTWVTKRFSYALEYARSKRKK